MARRCTVCDHHELAEIERLMDDSDTTLAEISSSFDLHRKSLQRHRDIHQPQRLARAVGQAAMAKAGLIAGVMEAGGEFLDDLTRHSIARKSERIGRLQQRFAQLEQIRTERAESYRRIIARDAERIREAEAKGEKTHPPMEPIPGWETGLLVRTLKTVAGAAVEEWKIDTGLLTQEQNLMDQAARELGDIGTGAALQGGGGVMIFQNIQRPTTPTAMPVLDLPRHVEGFISQRTHRPGDDNENGQYGE